jgi:hypothetical protein
MVVFSILFAFVIQSPARWLIEQITNGSGLEPGQLLGFVPYTLIGLMFFYAVYFWLFFSRVLIYVEEDDFGEFLSFLLAGAVLVIVSILRENLLIWPFLLAIPACIVTFKLLYLRSRAKDEVDLPLTPLLHGWLIWTGTVTLGLCALGLVTYPWEGDALVKARLWVNTLLPLILLVFGFYAVFWGGRKDTAVR